jgi:hypothetical protein
VVPLFVEELMANPGAGSVAMEVTDKETERAQLIKKMKNMDKEIGINGSGISKGDFERLREEIEDFELAHPTEIMGLTKSGLYIRLAAKFATTPLKRSSETVTDDSRVSKLSKTDYDTEVKTFVTVHDHASNLPSAILAVRRDTQRVCLCMRSSAGVDRARKLDVKYHMRERIFTRWAWTVRGKWMLSIICASAYSLGGRGLGECLTEAVCTSH